MKRSVEDVLESQAGVVRPGVVVKCASAETFGRERRFLLADGGG
jgi:hypothetical protein